MHEIKAFIVNTHEPNPLTVAAPVAGIVVRFTAVVISLVEEVVALVLTSPSVSYWIGLRWKEWLMFSRQLEGYGCSVC